MEGYLFRRDPVDGTVQRLYFVLKGFKMFLYANQGDLDAVDSILLLNIARVETAGSASPGFAIVTDQDVTFALEAESVAEKQRWVDALGSALERTQKVKTNLKAKEEEERKLREEQERRAREEEEKARRLEAERQRRHEVEIRRRVELSNRSRQEYLALMNEHKRMLEQKRRDAAQARATEAVAFAKRGGQLVKCIYAGGAPHPRYFAVSADGAEFKWGPNDKKLRSSVRIDEITRICVGVTTDVLKSTASVVSNPGAAHLCFSLLFKGRSVDCLCADRDSRDKWVVALQFLRYGLEDVLHNSPPERKPFEDSLLQNDLANIPRPWVPEEVSASTQSMGAAAAAASTSASSSMAAASSSAPAPVVESLVAQADHAVAAAAPRHEADAETAALVAEAGEVMRAAKPVENGEASMSAASSMATEATDAAAHEAHKEANHMSHEVSREAHAVTHEATSAVHSVEHEAQHAVSDVTRDVNREVNHMTHALRSVF